MPYHPRSISQSPSQRDCFTSPLADAHGFRTHLEAEQVMGLFWLVAFASTCWHCSLSNLSIALATLCRNSAIPFPEFWAPAIAKKKTKKTFDNQWCHCAMSNECFTSASRGPHSATIIAMSFCFLGLTKLWPGRFYPATCLAGWSTAVWHVAVSCCFSLQRSAVLRLFERTETGPPWTTKPQRIQDIQVQYHPTQIPDGTYTPDIVIFICRAFENCPKSQYLASLRDVANQGACATQKRE